MRPDDICRNNASNKVNLTIRILPKENDCSEVVLMEGDKSTFVFLSNLFSSFAAGIEDDGFHIDPKGAGKVLFSADATHGLYLHKIDE